MESQGVYVVYCHEYVVIEAFHWMFITYGVLLYIRTIQRR